MQQVANTWMWLGFSVFLIFALSADTFVFARYRSSSQVSIRRALSWTAFWISCALIFNLLLWLYLQRIDDLAFANTSALEFLAGYLIEKSLSIDNLFAFYVIFEHFRIPFRQQQYILTWGIWGAVIMRLIFIVIGVWLLTKFQWLLYIMGAFLFFTGVKMFFVGEEENDLSGSAVIKLAQRCFRVTTDATQPKFFVRKNKLIYVTPLFIVLILIEFSDVIFAFDSIPAILAITRDPFIVWTSNVFAILGLRALYFVLAQMVNRFHLLKYGVALILLFIGVKMMLMPWIHMPVVISLIIIGTIITTFIMLSLVTTRKTGK